MAVHNSSSDQLQKQIQRVLEFVVDTRWLQSDVHCPRKGRMIVGVQQETTSMSLNHGRHLTSFTHPRSSRNRQITLATSSSFLSSGPCEAFGFIFVRPANFSLEVAPRHRAKSIVEDLTPHITVKLLPSNNKTSSHFAFAIPPPRCCTEHATQQLVRRAGPSDGSNVVPASGCDYVGFPVQTRNGQTPFGYSKMNARHC